MAVRRGRVGLPQPSVLEIATEVLAGDPGASLAEIARAAGISRTTLHKLYPTRDALLAAAVDDALEVVTKVYADARLDAPGDEAPAALSRLATGLVPLGPRLMFLDHERLLDRDPAIKQRIDADFDEPVRVLEQRAKAVGVCRVDLPDGWVTYAFNALVYAAWEQIAAGRLAPMAAAGVVVSTLLSGVSVASSKPS